MIDHFFVPRTVGIPLNDMSELDDDVPVGQIASLIAKQIQKTKYSISRGDTVTLICNGEKCYNHFTQVWDGIQAIWVED